MMRLSSDPYCRLCRLMFCVTMALVWVLPPGWQARGAEPPAPEMPRAQRAAQARNGLRALADARAQLTRDTFDVGAVVKEVGANPAALFQWVRDRTCWVPYRGILRGDVGVLMDGLGNSLDRAGLLWSLLKSAGQEARLAHAELDEPLAESLLPKVRTQPVPVKRAGTKPGGPSPVLAAARAHQIDEALVKSTLGKYVAQTAQVQRQVYGRVAAAAPLLKSALGAPDAGAAAEHAAAVRALRDHWWVQWQSGGKWVDLDPLLPDAKPGQTVTAPQQTANPADLSPDLRQQVVVRVIVERWKDKKPEQVTALEHVVRPSQVIGKVISLAHYPMDWPGDFNFADPNNFEARVKGAVLAQHEWVPMLQVGSETVSQSSFAENGEINPKPNLSGIGRSSTSVAGAGQGVLGAFGGDDAAPPAAGALTAEWIEYEIRVPGEAPRRERREVFDLIGPAARAAGNSAQPTLNDVQRLDRALALFGETDILVSGCRLSAPYLTGLTLDAVLSNEKVILAVADDDASLASPATAKDLVQQVKPMPGDLEQFAYARFVLSRYHNAQYIARPNIVTRHLRLRDEGGKLMGCRALDIVANNVAVRPGSKAPAFDVRLEQGVVDTNLESALLTGCGQVHSAAEAFAAAGNDPAKWVTLNDAHDAALAQLPVSADVKTRITSDLAAGYAVMVPKAPSTSMASWWRIDPASGTALGIGQNGWGPSLVEYAESAVIGFGVAFTVCEVGGAILFPDMPNRTMVKWCFVAGVLGALFAVLGLFLLEGEAAAAGAGAESEGAAAGGGGSPVDPLGKTLPGGPGGAGGAGPGPLPGGGGGGGGPGPLPGGGGGGAGGGSAGGAGGGSPGGIDPLGRTLMGPDTTYVSSPPDATLAGSGNTLAGIGAIVGSL